MWDPKATLITTSVVQLESDMVEKHQYPDVAALALESLSDPSKWTIGTRNDGKGKHCVIGHLEIAFKAFGLRQHPEIYMEEMATLMGFGGGAYHYLDALMNMAAHNNNHTHAEVVQRFSVGIETMKQALAS